MIKIYPATLIIVGLISLLKTTPIFSQISGCKDPLASNYNPSATKNDGSCLYGTTSYTPPSKVNPINSILIESSGLQWADNSLWSFNDGGGAAAIYRIDTLTNALLQTINLENATNVDWEDIAFDGTYFYVGDFGNNYDGARNDLKIYKFPLSAIPDYTTNPNYIIPAAQIGIIKFSYSDQPRPLQSTPSPNTTKYDCEAMIVDNGKIHLFTKNWIDFTTTHYVIDNLQPDSSSLLPLETLNIGYLVTAADKAPNKPIIVLLGYLATSPGNHFMHLLSDYSGNLYFNGNKRQINLPNALYMGQSEGVTFRTDTYGYISNERVQGVFNGTTYTIANQMLHQFDINALVPQYILPLQLINFNAININGSTKITWSFDSPIPQLELQKSSNNTNDFKVVNTFYNTQTGGINDNNITGSTYYRLAWKDKDGTIKYSNIINIKSAQINSAANFNLKSNGQLTFILNGDIANYSLRLLDVEGRILFELPEHAYTTGSNSIKLPINNHLTGIVFLTMYNKAQTITEKIHVE